MHTALVLCVFWLFWVCSARFWKQDSRREATQLERTGSLRSGADTDSFCFPWNLGVCSAKHDIKHSCMKRSVCSSPENSPILPLLLLTSAFSAKCEGVLPSQVRKSVLSPPPLVPAPGRSRPHKCSAARRKTDPMARGEPPPLHRRLRARMEALSPQPGRCY